MFVCHGKILSSLSKSGLDTVSQPGGNSPFLYIGSTASGIGFFERSQMRESAGDSTKSVDVG